MELYQLKCFLAAAERENFSRAAEDVHISQSSISKIITRLEDELGVSLFDRKKGHISLSVNGVLFQKYVTSAMQALDDGIALVRETASVEQNTVRVACSSIQKMETILDEVQIHHPECLFSLDSMAQEELLSAFEQGKVDIGVLESSQDFDSPLFEKLHKQYFVVFLTEKHSAAHQKRFYPEQISEEIICFSGQEDVKRFLVSMFAAEGVHPKVFVEYPSVRMTAQLINTGQAIGIVPDDLYYLRKRVAKLEPLLALPINSRWYRSVYMLRRVAPERQTQIDQLYALLREQILLERMRVEEFYQNLGIDFEALS